MVRSKIEEINNYDGKVRSISDEKEQMNRKIRELTDANKDSGI